jgi:hypothetical protein
MGNYLTLTAFPPPGLDECRDRGASAAGGDRAGARRDVTDDIAGGSVIVNTLAK